MKLYWHYAIAIWLLIFIQNSPLINYSFVLIPPCIGWPNFYQTKCKSSQFYMFWFSLLWFTSQKPCPRRVTVSCQWSYLHLIQFVFNLNQLNKEDKTACTFFWIFHDFFWFILYYPGFYSSLSDKKRRNGKTLKLLWFFLKICYFL